MLNFFEILSFFYFHNLQTLLGEGSPTLVLIIDTYLYQLYASFFFCYKAGSQSYGKSFKLRWKYQLYDCVSNVYFLISNNKMQDNRSSYKCSLDYLGYIIRNIIEEIKIWILCSPFLYTTLKFYESNY
jgi:hypothetical protein